MGHCTRKLIIKSQSHLTIEHSRITYARYEIFAFSGKTCRKGWTYTRVPQLEFIGEANEEINNVRDINECRNLCLASSVYQCRSATYDKNSQTCRLTEETRRSAPSDFRIAERGVDYIENECAESKLI